MEAKKTARPVAYAMPIGGGWAYFCASCFEAHHDDVGSDAGVVAECEPVSEIPAGEVAGCEICGLLGVGHRFEDAEDALKRALDATVGRPALPTETATIEAIEAYING